MTQFIVLGGYQCPIRLSCHHPQDVSKQLNPVHITVSLNDPH